MQKNQLIFIFTEKGILAESHGEGQTESDVYWEEQFTQDSFPALYHYGMDHVSAGTASAVFAKKLMEVFLEKLTDLPELELVREHAKIVLQQEEIDRLLLSLPFCLGAEYVTENWITMVFDRLNAVFSQEMKQFEGTVALYLASRNQKLMVPERVFFHLVKSKEGEFPFVFLATYASLKENHKVQHMPLRYALTEYQGQRQEERI